MSRRLQWLFGLIAGGIVFIFCCFAGREIWVQTSTDQFCSRCHSMHPYVRAHQAGAHQEISCRVCHIGDQLLPAMQAKMQGARFLAKHYMGGGQHPEGVVSNRVCQQESCHPGGGGDSLPWQGVMFHHSQHQKNGRMRLGVNTRCTLCHGKTLASGHGTKVRENACLLCHLGHGQLPEGEDPDQACLVCHSLPAEFELGGGARFEHARAAKEGHKCKDCHQHLLQIGGAVEAGKCTECHHEKAVDFLKQDDFRDRVHYQHNQVLSINCNQCHGPVKHFSPTPWHPDFPLPGKRCPHVGGRSKLGKERSMVRIDCLFCHPNRQSGLVRKGRCNFCHENKSRR